MALLLREADVGRLGDIGLVDIGAVMDGVEAAMIELGRGEAQNQPRRRVFPPGGVLNVMFASWPGGGVSGLKSYMVAGGRARFLVLLYNLGGELLALIEADRLGTFRTGAATGVAARRLIPPGPKTVAVIGSGWQARTQVAALRRALDVVELRVFSRTPERRERFAAEVAGVVAVSAEAAVRGADVVVTSTNSASPVLEAEWVEPGALVVGTGSNYPTRAELPAGLVHGARAVVVDQLEAAQLESGDLLCAGFEVDRALELGAILADKVAVPEGEGPLIFESHGLALWDLAAGKLILDAARAAGVGEEVTIL
jgi:alanine dehydrogenase